jgi:hypothetical protein
MWKSDANTSTTAANGSSWSSPNASRLSWQQGVAKSWQGIAHAPAHYPNECVQLGRSHIKIWCNICFACSSRLVMLRARVYAVMTAVYWV